MLVMAGVLLAAPRLSTHQSEIVYLPSAAYVCVLFCGMEERFSAPPSPPAMRQPLMAPSGSCEPPSETVATRLVSSRESRRRAATGALFSVFSCRNLRINHAAATPHTSSTTARNTSGALLL